MGREGKGRGSSGMRRNLFGQCGCLQLRLTVAELTETKTDARIPWLDRRRIQIFQRSTESFLGTTNPGITTTFSSESSCHSENQRYLCMTFRKITQIYMA
jgi:hypothetical protein